MHEEEDGDEKLTEIAAALSDGDAEDPRLLSLVRGALSAEGRASLERDAASDRRLADAMEMLTPLSDGLEDRLVESALRQARGRPGRAWGRAALVVATAGAMAAGFAVWVGGARARGEVPNYRLELAPLRSEYRSKIVSSPIAVEDPIEVVLRPEVEVLGAIEARLFVSADGGAFESRPRVVPTVERGAVRWVGRVRDWAPGAKRRVQLLAIVGRPGATPSPPEATVRGKGRGWRSLRVDLTLRRGTLEPPEGTP